MPDKVAGKYVHMQHVRVANMLHGRVVRPRGQRAYGSGAKVAQLDESSIADIPGARVVRRGDFVGVVAEREWDAVKAARAARHHLGGQPGLARSEPSCPKCCARRSRPTPWSSMSATRRSGFAQAAHVASATYFSPYQAHAPFGPNCALADVGADSALVLSSTQDVYASRAKCWRRCSGCRSSGCGSSTTKDRARSAIAATRMRRRPPRSCRRLAGRPVRVQFMRWDELGWDNYGPAQLAEVRAAIDADGKIIAYTYDGWQHGWHINETSTELAMQTPPAERTAGTLSIVVNRMSTGSMYRIPNRRVVSHAVPMVGLAQRLAAAFAARHGACRSPRSRRSTSWRMRRRWIRSNSGAATWAIRAGSAFSMLPPRRRAGRRAPAASRLSDGEVVTGRGIAVGTHHVSYGAAVAEIEVNKRTGNIIAKHLYGALDCGLDRQSGAGREPDRRHDGPGDEPDAQGGGDVRQQRASPASIG